MKDLDNQPAIQAIKAAENSLKLARQLLSRGPEKKDLSNLSFVEGSFDGTHMVDASGKRYKVNENYATKSMLVCGDKLRAYDDHGKYWFKQVDKVKREKVSGMLTKKANVWHVVTADGSYKVSPEAVSFLNLKVNDEVDVYLPAGNKRVSFATLDFVKKRSSPKEAEEAVVEKKEKTKEKKEERKAPPKKKEELPEKKEVKERIVLEEDDLR